MKCPKCGSEEIVTGIRTGHTAETGSIGPRYTKSIFQGVEPLLCDICTGCGEVLRFYVQDYKDKKWVQKK
jgi:hypothetical protein